MIKFIFLTLCLLTSYQKAFAQCNAGQAFTCFDQSDADLIFKDLTSAFAPTTVSGASSLGKIFGVELGLVISASRAPNTTAVVKSYGSSFDIPAIPMAGISGIFTLPYGIGIEGSIIPKVDISSYGSFESTNIGARWTITDLLPMGFFKIAIRGSYLTSNTSITHAEDSGNILIGTVTENANFDVDIVEMGGVIGLNFKIVEPYLGVSNLKSDGSIVANGSTTTGAPIPDVDQKSSLSGSRFYGGVLIKFPLLRIGAEVATIEDVERASIKIAFKF